MIRYNLSIVANLELTDLDNKNKIKKIIEPIVIIGAASGIGLEMFKLFKINKTVPIIGTFNKNKIFEQYKSQKRLN